MTQYAYYDSAAPQPAAVLGWYDTVAVTYPSLPLAANLLQVTPDEWAARHPGPWAVEGQALVPGQPIQRQTPDLVMKAAFIVGCEVKSASNPSLNATYVAYGQPWTDMQSEAQFITTFQEFSADNPSSLVWGNVAGSPVTFTSVNDFLAVAKGIAKWVTAWKQYTAGQVSNPPTLPVAIP